jgi:hypothetical protein
VNKLNLSAVSLVAALPAAVLAYLLVMVVVNDPGIDQLATFLQIVVVLSLLAAAMLALMPIGIFLFVGRSNNSTTGPVAGRRSAAGAGAVAAGAAGVGAAALADDEFATEEDIDEEIGTADEFGDEFESEEDLSDHEIGGAEVDEFDDFDNTDSEEGDLFGSDEGFDTFELGGDEDDEK